MIFTSFEFCAFLMGVLLLRACCRSFGMEKWLLLAASYLFYASWNWAFAGLLFAVSFTDYWVGRVMSTLADGPRRRTLMVASLVVNLGLLCFFKYANFLLGNAGWLASWLGSSWQPPHLDVILPAGISFFTFQSMSYTLDVYRRQIEPCRSLRDFLLFVSFFPQLVAGPIVRAAEFLPQLAARCRATLTQVESGLALFALGAVKKGVISDQISTYVDGVFSAPGQHDAPTLLLALFGYTAQIYCDFSGYSDMAIGVARMMGYHFPENFRMPYASLNITEFWRRWHISLSTWLRDYLYIPLGGNRLGSARTYANLMITMLLGGLWHGAGWNFLIWGALHGGALAVHRGWRHFFPASETGSWPGRIFSHAATLGVVMVGWVFFRCQGFDAAKAFLVRLFSWQTGGTHSLSPQTLVAVGAVALVHLLVCKDTDWSLRIVERPVPARILAYAGLLLLIVTLAASDAAPFIYFQF